MSTPHGHQPGETIEVWRIGGRMYEVVAWDKFYMRVQKYSESYKTQWVRNRTRTGTVETLAEAPGARDPGT